MENINLQIRNNFQHNRQFTETGRIFILFILFLFSGCQMKANEQEEKISSAMKKIEIGDTIPDIVLKNQDGKLFNLKSETKGKNVVLYFYPMDNTRGCTAEACSFRDQINDFINANAKVIGISSQSEESHKKFAEKNNLPFTLLSDKGNKVRKMFGVPTNFFGLFPGRVTYIINKEHKVVYIFNSQTKIQDHIDNALKKLKEIE